MSWLPTSKSKLEDDPYIDAIILPRTSDIGNFEVQRVLPSKEKQMVGPFISVSYTHLTLPTIYSV